MLRRKQQRNEMNKNTIIWPVCMLSVLVYLITQLLAIQLDNRTLDEQTVDTADMHTSGPILKDVASDATPDEAEFLLFSHDCITTGASSHNDHMMYHIFGHANPISYVY